jgi:hypothetical protein
MMYHANDVLRKVFLPSPRNSLAAHVALLTELECTKLALTEPCAPCVPAILKEMDMHTVVIPSLSQLLEAEESDDKTPHKAFADAKDDPSFVLHTSGSTGKHSRLHCRVAGKSRTTTSTFQKSGKIEGFQRTSVHLLCSQRLTVGYNGVAFACDLFRNTRVAVPLHQFRSHNQTQVLQSP